MQVTWLNERHRIKGLAKRRAWIVWTHGPPDHDRARALKVGVIMAQISRVGVHPDRRIAIQRAQFDAFNNVNPRGLIRALHQDQTVAI